jgi:hypothetical protein
LHSPPETGRNNSWASRTLSGRRCVNRLKPTPCSSSRLALLALAAGLVFALPDSVRASCGDHTHTAVERANQRPCTPGVDCPPPAPCTGPTCRAPDNPLPTPPASSRHVLQEWALAPTPLRADARGTALLGTDASNLRAFHRAFPPDPPPRLLLAD